MLSCFFVVISINMMLEVINSAKLMSLSFNRGMLQNKGMGGGNSAFHTAAEYSWWYLSA